MNTPQTPYPESIEPEEISRLAELHFGEPVKGITAPGGESRDSLRVYFEDRSIIASYRYRAARREREILVLEKLQGAGAPVPEFLGSQGALLFQSDVGKGRLSTQLHRRDQDGQIKLAEAAFASLWEIKRAARDSGLTAELPPVAASAKWVSQFTTDSRKLANKLEIPAPKADFAAISRAIVPVPRHFVKWDARSGNAAVQGDGRVMWFDWEHAGRRHGIEDFGFLIADEFWSLSPEESLQAFARTCPGNTDALLPDLIRFSTLQAGERLRLIQKEVFKRGWTRFERARRYDRMGAVPELAMNVAKHADQLAAMDPLTAPLSGWYEQAAEALFDWWKRESQSPEENAP